MTSDKWRLLEHSAALVAALGLVIGAILTLAESCGAAP